MAISLKQKRFLIIWVAVNLFALFVNLAEVKGAFEIGKNQKQYLWTSGGDKKDFWPFTYFIDHVPGRWSSDLGWGHEPYYRFCGLFNSYGVPEFVGYMLLGLGIVIIPKLWK